MINQIPYLWDKPVTVWLGIVVILCLFATATLGFLLHRGRVAFPVHRAMAAATVLAALVHGGFAFYAYFA
jgi:hypothetical protein